MQAMADPQQRMEHLERRLARESAARAAAEKLLEDKALELYTLNRQLADEAERARQLTEAIELSGEAICITDAEGRFRYMNGAFAHMFGFESAEAGLGASAFDLYGPAETERFHSLIYPSLRDQGSWRGEAVAKTLKGKPIQQEVLVTALKDGGLICATRDIRERKVQQSAVDEVKERVAQSSKTNALMRMASIVSHDVNNLVGAISTYGSLLEKTLSREPEAAAKLAGIMRAADAAAELVETINGFRRSSIDELRAADLNMLALEACGRFERAGASLYADLGSAALPVLADPGLLRLAIEALVANGLDAAGVHGVCGVSLRRLAAASEPPCVGRGALTSVLQSPPEGPVLRLTVTDNGLGMDQSVLDNAFEPFFTTRAAQRRLGIGLNLVLNAARRHGAGLNISTKPGGGTIVTLDVPEFAGLLEDEAGSEEPLSDKQVSVLLVDDDPLAGQSMAEALRAAGLEANWCERAEEALTMIRAAPRLWDVVITDRLMPGMSGEAFAAIVRHERPDLPFVLHSGNVDDLVDQSLFAAIVRKPAGALTLSLQIRRAAARRKA